MLRILFFLIPILSVAQSDSTVYLRDCQTYAYPCWQGCDSLAKEYARRRCTSDQIKSYNRQNFRYPSDGSCINGTGVVQVLITETGEVEDVKVLRELGGVTEEAIIRLVKSYPLLIPAICEGQPVRTWITYPVKIQLE